MGARALALVVCCLVILPSGIAAQERGRLQDGRAFRVGTDGFRLVDEVAELQVSNDDLRKQVALLESELDQKEASAGSCTVPEQKAAPTSATPDCDELVSSLYMRISRLERLSQGAKDSNLPAAALPIAAPSQNQQATEAKLQAAQAEIARLTQEVVESRQQLAEEQVSGRNREAQLLQAVEAKEQAANVAAAQEEARRPVVVASAPAPIEPAAAPVTEEIEETVTSSAVTAATVADAAATTAAPAIATETAKTDTSRARMNTPVSSAVAVDPVETERASLERNLASIDSLISKRKSHYDSLKAKNGVIAVQLRRLVTAKGVSLDSLRRQIQRMNDVSQSASIRAGLNEIAMLLREDITLIKRYSK